MTHDLLHAADHRLAATQAQLAQALQAQSDAGRSPLHVALEAIRDARALLAQGAGGRPGRSTQGADAL